MPFPQEIVVCTVFLCGFVYWIPRFIIIRKPKTRDQFMCLETSASFFLLTITNKKFNQKWNEPPKNSTAKTAECSLGFL